MGEVQNTPSGGGGRILVSGANGQVGKELKKIAPAFPQFDFMFLSKEDLPIHHFKMVRDYFSVYKPSFFINCAAFTVVDRAEQEKDKAFQVNGESVGVLAAVCHEHHCKLIHISTDYVFDGSASTPYNEDTPTNPQSVYGASKLEGEKLAVQFNPDTIIIRTSWVYSEYGKNFVKTMVKLMQEKEAIDVVNDQVGSPTYARDLGITILEIIVRSYRSSSSWIPGIYHYSNEGGISWYDFALAIKELTGSECGVNPVTTDQYPTLAKRPGYSVLDNAKVQRTFGIRLKKWKVSLAYCLERLRNASGSPMG